MGSNPTGPANLVYKEDFTNPYQLLQLLKAVHSDLRDCLLHSVAAAKQSCQLIRIGLTEKGGSLDSTKAVHASRQNCPPESHVSSLDQSSSL